MSSFFVVVLISLSSYGSIKTLNIIVSDDTSVELGALVGGQLYSMSLPVELEETATIKDVRASCPCFTVTQYPKELINGRGSIELTFKKDKIGPFNYSVFIQFSDNTDLLQFKLRGSIVEGQPIVPVPVLSDAVKKMVVRKLIEPDRTLYTPIRKVLYKGRQNPQYTLIDVRDRAEVHKLYIPGVKNYTPLQLRTASHLKNTKLVLVGKLPYDQQLEKLSAKMSSHGFKSVTILEGGIQSWINAGGQLYNPKKIANFTLTPAESFQLRHFTSVQFVALSSPSELEQELFPGIISAESLVDSKRKTGAVVIVNGAGKDIETKVPLFILDGGAEAYKEYLTAQTKYLAPKSVSTNKQLSCCK